MASDEEMDAEFWEWWNSLSDFDKEMVIGR